MDTSHPARDHEEEERGAAAELAAKAGAAPPPKLEDLLGGGVVNGESASGGGGPVAAPEATAPAEMHDSDLTRHHQHGLWQSRAAGDKKDAYYLGTFSTQEEAAEAYDIAAIKFRGLNAFEMSGGSIPTGSMSGDGRSNKALDSPPSGSPGAMPVEASSAAPLFAALPVKYDDQQQQDNL